MAKEFTEANLATPLSEELLKIFKTELKGYVLSEEKPGFFNRWRKGKTADSTEQKYNPAQPKITHAKNS